MSCYFGKVSTPLDMTMLPGHFVIPSLGLFILYQLEIIALESL
jgi:hypothetical protein